MIERRITVKNQIHWYLSWIILQDIVTVMWDWFSFLHHAIPIARVIIVGKQSNHPFLTLALNFEHYRCIPYLRDGAIIAIHCPKCQEMRKFVVITFKWQGSGKGISKICRRTTDQFHQSLLVIYVLTSFSWADGHKCDGIYIVQHMLLGMRQNYCIHSEPK